YKKKNKNIVSFPLIIKKKNQEEISITIYHQFVLKTTRYNSPGYTK
ncbi:unnamed protein product, partial [Staurois parvus]